MSLGEWKPIPDGLLKMRMTSKAFGRLTYDVQVLISNLAEEQGYKCALCSAKRDLIVEHDHYPEHGAGDTYTVFNIRGLVCQRCNWHLMIYEKDLNGEYRGFDDVYSNISDHVWENYIDAYNRRVIRLHESRLEERMGGAKYWRRRIFIDKFDDWREYGARKRHFPWHWGFDEIKERKKNTIRSPEQFFKMLAAIVQYLKNELAKNPDWEPPEELLLGLVRLKPFLDSLRPIIESRLAELRNVNNAAAGASA